MQWIAAVEKSADSQTDRLWAALEKQPTVAALGSRVDDAATYQAEGILYLFPKGRFDHLGRLPEAKTWGKRSTTRRGRSKSRCCT